jgi:RecA-family ATPase
MALKHEGLEVSAWAKWSSGDKARFKDGECESKWDTFHEDTEKSPITGGTLVQMAKEYGYEYVPKEINTDKEIDFSELRLTDDDYRAAEGQGANGPDYIQVPEWLKVQEPFAEPENGAWDPVLDTCKFLFALFTPSETVAIADTSEDDKGGWKIGAGNTFTVGEITKRLEEQRTQYYSDHGIAAGAFPSNTAEYIGKVTVHTLYFTVRSTKDTGGAFIKINPVDRSRDPEHKGSGITDKMVTAYRYVLVECDSKDTPPATQIAILKGMGIPIRTLVYSGNKSIHALVPVYAADKDDYKKKCEYIFKECRRHGLEPDEQNKNPSRYTRLPGVFRGNGENLHKQFLVATDIGADNFREWQESIESERAKNALPKPVNLADMMKNPKPLPPQIIDGLLRKGGNMMIQAPSKAGKTQLLLELCVAFAEGLPFLDCQCRQGHVLYINFEVMPEEIQNRFIQIYETLKLPPPYHMGNITVANLRGQDVDMNKLPLVISAWAEKGDYLAVMIDPIYKLLNGEIDAKDVTPFTKAIDRIEKLTGCAVIYTHHYSKGAKGNVEAGDRSSGSGVFVRNADAVIDMCPLKVRNEDGTPTHEKAYRISFPETRSFPDLPPVTVVYQWPLHTITQDPKYVDAKEVGSFEDIFNEGRQKGNDKKKAEKAQRIEKMKSAVSAYKETDEYKKNQYIPVDYLTKQLEVDPKTIQNYVKKDLKEEGWRYENRHVYMN